MNRIRLPLILALSALTGGCFLQSSDMAEVLPDDRLLVNMPLASDLSKDLDEKNWATYYLLTAEVTEDVNWMVGTVLYWVDTITHEYRPSYVNSDQTEALWGPWAGSALDPTMNQLWVTHDIETDTYAWGLDRWPKESSEEDAVTVVLGDVDAGATRDVSSGGFSIDFDSINLMDPTEETTGQFEVDYDIREDGVGALASFVDFGPDALHASYAFDQTFGGDGLMDLTVDSDMDGLGQPERLIIRSRWQADGSGRSDVAIKGGDLGDAVGTATECWDSGFERVYYIDDVGGVEEGDISLCVFDNVEYSEEAE